MCKCKCIVYNTTAVNSDGTNLNLYFNADFQNPQVRQKFNFRICQQIPASSESQPVQININGTNYPLLNKFGEQAVGSELCCGKLYCGYYAGLTQKHFITCDAPSGCCNK